MFKLLVMCDSAPYYSYYSNAQVVNSNGQLPGLCSQQLVVQTGHKKRRLNEDDSNNKNNHHHVKKHYAFDHDNYYNYYNCYAIYIVEIDEYEIGFSEAQACPSCTAALIKSGVHCQYFTTVNGFIKEYIKQHNPHIQ